MNALKNSSLTHKLPSILCFIFSGLSCMMQCSLYAQQRDFRLQKSPAGFYLVHNVLPKQGLFSIGRQYMVHPHFLATFNGLDPNKGLQIDQLIRVPLTDTNFDRRVGEGIPIYLTASAEEGIADLASFVGTEAALVQCWNAFDGGVVKKDTRWIIGFLKAPQPSARRVKLSCSSQPAQRSASHYEQAYIEQIQRKPVSRNSTIAASFFASESGWGDGKFYVLLNGVSPGTIVKLINEENKKEVYAMVLGEMPRIKQNEGLDLRVNDAALDRLVPASRARFSLQLVY